MFLLLYFLHDVEMCVASVSIIVNTDFDFKKGTQSNFDTNYENDNTINILVGFFLNL